MDVVMLVQKKFTELLISWKPSVLCVACWEPGLRKIQSEHGPSPHQCGNTASIL